MKWNSAEERILRYLSKVNPDAPEWATNEHVQRVLVDRRIDLTRLRDLFAERGICGPDDFDAAVVSLKAAGLLDQDGQLLKPGKDEHDRVKDLRKADVEEIGTHEPWHEDDKKKIKLDLLSEKSY